MQSIHDIPVFSGLSADVLAAIESLGKEIILGKGDILFDQGETATAFYVVLRGGMRLVEHTPEGKDINLKIYGVGDVFGMLAISGTYMHPAKVIALSPSVVLGFDGSAVRQLIHNHPAVGLRIIDVLIDHVHHAHDRIRHMAIEKTERRLARALLHFCRTFNLSVSPQQLSANFSQRDIAEFTGTTVETVSRFFTDWEEKGYIKRERVSVTILHPEQLERIVEEEGEPSMGYHLL